MPLIQRRGCVSTSSPGPGQSNKEKEDEEERPSHLRWGNRSSLSGFHISCISFKLHIRRIRKAIISLLIAYSLLLILFVGRPSLGSDRRGRDHGVAKSPVEEALNEETSFAVVINTFKRPSMLKGAVKHWFNLPRQCGVNISQVFVVWSEFEVTPPNIYDLLDDGGGHMKYLREMNPTTTKYGGPSVEYIKVAKDSLNSRFLPIVNLSSSSVFMVDDDLRIDCNSMASGFEAWRHNSDSMVGFYPRLASHKNGLLPSNAEIIYHTWPTVWLNQKFNMILSKASFLDSKYLAMYHDEKYNPKEVLEYVDRVKNCEDIAMAMLIAKNAGPRKGTTSSKSGHCNACPIYIRGKIRDEGLFNGISTRSKLSSVGHMEQRSLCLDEMTKIHGGNNPLFDVSLEDQMPSNTFEWFSFGNMLT